MLSASQWSVNVVYRFCIFCWFYKLQRINRNVAPQHFLTVISVWCSFCCLVAWFSSRHNKRSENGRSTLLNLPWRPWHKTRCNATGEPAAQAGTFIAEDGRLRSFRHYLLPTTERSCFQPIWKTTMRHGQTRTTVGDSILRIKSWHGDWAQ